jgi:hypothetical protein
VYSRAIAVPATAKRFVLSREQYRMYKLVGEEAGPQTLRFVIINLLLVTELEVHAAPQSQSQTH